MYKMVAVTIREVLVKADVFQGWLYLPDKPWLLDTEGIFVREDLDADPSAPFPPVVLSPCQLKEALDAASIEDIISNAEQQLAKPTLENLLEAFLFYMENDAFIEF
jgi:hypothetical protein